MRYLLSQLRRITITWLLCILATTSLAQPTTNNLHPLVAAFPNSQLIESEIVGDVVHQVALGILQRNRNRAEPEQSLRIEGDLSKFLHEVAREFRGEDVAEYFKEQFESKGYQFLFECIGRSCGSSNDWANDIFGNRVLYGPAQNQFYFVYKDSNEDMESYVAVYIITRGNRRTYAYIEIMETQKGPVSQVSELSSSIMDLGYYILPKLALISGSELSVEALDEITEFLEVNPTIDLYLVDHYYGEGALNDLLDSSFSRANSLVQQLIDAGVDENRILARGVGPLSPGCAASECGNRVELVRQ